MSKLKPTCTCTTTKTCALCACIHEAARFWAARLPDSEFRYLYRQSQLPPAARASSLNSLQSRALLERASGGN